MSSNNTWSWFGAANIVDTTLRYSSYFFLLVASIVLIGWPYISGLFPENYDRNTQVLGVVIAATVFFIVYFDIKLSRIDKQISSHNIGCVEFDKILDRAPMTKKRYNNVKIFASASSEIVMLFSRMSDIEIDSCELCLREDTYHKGAITLKNIKSSIDFSKERWGVMKNNGRIKKLSLMRYDFIPSFYLIVFDDEFMVMGNFIIDTSDESPTNFKTIDPLIITKFDKSGAKIIENYTNWYDSFKDLYESEEL